ncbi:hypothetical protein Tco_0133762 [Tanacetum coccineum]
METVKLLKSQNDQLLRDLEKSSLMVLGYKKGLESVEEKHKFYKKNESVYVEKINGLKWDIQVGEITISELRKKLEKLQKAKDSIHINVDKFENASKSLDKLIENQIVYNCKKGLGYNAVPHPYTGNFMPPKPDLSFIGLDEFVNEPVVENRNSDEEVSKVVRKFDGAPGNPQMDLQDKGVIDSGCSRHMTGNMCHCKRESNNRASYHFGKFDGKADEGFFVRYALNSKAFRVFNSRTRIVEENLHIRFCEITPNIVGSGPDWLFDIDALTRTMNYEPIVAGTQSNDFVGTKASDNVGQARKGQRYLSKTYILLSV